MKVFGITLLIMWAIIIAFPDILAYLLAVFFIISWINLIIAWSKMWSFKNWKEEYVQFWKYKIFKN